MKTVVAFIIGSAFTLAFLVHCGSSTNSAKAGGGNWEYASIDAYTGYGVKMPSGQSAPSTSDCIQTSNEAETVTCILNKLGSSGWQLVGVINSQYGGEFYLGRQK